MRVRSVGLVKQKLSAAAIWGHKREGQNLEGDMIADCQGLGFRVQTPEKSNCTEAYDIAGKKW